MSKDLTHLISDEYETKDGRPARIVAVTNHAEFPLVAVITDVYGREFATVLTEKFERVDSDTPCLRRKPKQETREIWLNVYPNADMELYLERTAADAYEEYRSRQSGHTPRIACVKVTVTFKHGEGL